MRQEDVGQELHAPGLSGPQGDTAGTRKLLNPPIVQAVCDFSFDLGSQWDPAAADRVHERIRTRFPKINRADLHTSAEGSEDTVHFSNHDETATIHIGPDGLAVTHMRPYPGWGSFLPMIEATCDAYVQVIKPQSFTQMLLRYINRIDFPEKIVAVNEYLTVYPHLGDDLPRSFGSFFIGLRFPYEGDRDLLQMEMVGPSAEDDGTNSVTLDFSYFMANSGTVGLDHATEWLQSAHTHIREIFDGCLTTEARAMFERGIA